MKSEPLDSNQLRQAAIRLLSVREHSRFELRRKLGQRAADRLQFEEVLIWLADQGYQSEERFVEQYVRNRKMKGFGPVRIRLELLERGVDAVLLDKWLNDQSDDWRELLERARKKKFGSQRPLEYKAQLRQARFLEYRGFPPERVKRPFLFLTMNHNFGYLCNEVGLP